jgi:hypothetical protein
MWRRVDLMWTDISEERIATIFRVEKSASEEPEDGILRSHRRENLKILHNNFYFEAFLDYKCLFS